MNLPYLRLVPQRHQMDCAVAVLAMVLQLSYEEVLIAFRHNVMARGATLKQMQVAARRLGRRIQWRRKLDLEQDHGILVVGSPLWAADHLVVLKDGLVIDTDFCVWDADVYMTAYEARAMGLMVERSA